ncbi:hypothetical protein [Leptolyngbya sp. BC1307]|uniref:hypothetical protein n=1 Tax=Leptolyngbya sp. BC1307 TaxID=2029589 RepID=UPI000EFA9912|nr:hypothetical protein [Leptolyngbya sp. BC1307]
MTEVEHKRIAVGFKTKQALQQAKRALEAKSLSHVEMAEVLASEEATTPEEREPKSGISSAAATGGLVGAIAGSLIVTIALSVPNLLSIQGNEVPFFVLVPLLGAVIGAAASSFMVFMSGAAPTRLRVEKYQLTVEALPENTQLVTEILLEKGGRLL